MIINDINTSFAFKFYNMLPQIFEQIKIVIISKCDMKFKLWIARVVSHKIK